MRLFKSKIYLHIQMQLLEKWQSLVDIPINSKVEKAKCCR
jgi:hypothetical protein